MLLPYVQGKVLMQLRDDRAGIAHPRAWGFFGGSICEGETPEEAVRREAIEELRYEPETITKLGAVRIPDLHHLSSHAYYCSLTVSVESLVLNEGMDLGLFTREELRLKRLHSAKMKQDFPIADTPYILATVEQLFHRLGM